MASISFPPPDKLGGQPLMRALALRRTTRVFANRELGDQLTGDLFWAAWGINRPDGRRTAPSALNSQDITLYAIRADGVWRYDASGHALILVAQKDLRTALGQSQFVATAPLTVVCVAAPEKSRAERYAYVHAGSIIQNIGLFCASAGLNNVVRASFNADTLAAGMGLPPRHIPLLTQSVGWQA